MDTLRKTSFWLCVLAAIACGLYSTYLLFFTPAYETGVVGFIALGFSFGLATIAAVINRGGNK
jgi:hypothetical protein